MKTIKKLSILFLSLVAFYACNDEQLNVDNFDGNVVDGGLLDVKSTSLNYVVGNPGPYTATMRVYQGEAKTTSIRVSKTFFTSEIVVDPITGKDKKVVLKSNTIDDFKTITISDTDQNSINNYSFNFTELIEGLSVEGEQLPSSDADYLVGDYWQMDYYVTNSNGEHQNYASTKATVSTRFAGTYNILKGNYWRIDEFRPDVVWPTQLVIESYDATIYKHIGVGGFLDDAGDPNDFYFTVDNATGAITVLETDPDGTATTLNGLPIMTCENITFGNAPCEGSNIAIKNDETGEDMIKLTVGYLASSGQREFYEEIEKVVD